MELQFKGKYLITGRLICESGLHIGGSTEGFEIGGVDNPVIRDPLTEWPYIPGSSLKGKLRHLLEWSLTGNPYTGKPHHFTEEHRREGVEFKPCSCGRCEACVLFGTTPEHGIQKLGEKPLGFATQIVRKENEEQELYAISGPSRLTVRDAFPTLETVEKWKQWIGPTYTELKTENAIDRVTSEANPRTMERVPAGSEFTIEMLVDIYRDTDKELLKSLFTAMHLLEHSALGGSGTRGHGKVKFADLTLTFRSLGYYFFRDGEQVLIEARRDNLQEPTKFLLSGKLSGEIPYQRSLVKHLAEKLNTILA